MKYFFIAMIILAIALLVEAYPYKKYRFKLFLKFIFCFYYYKLISKEYKPKDKNHKLYNFIENFIYCFKFLLLTLIYLLLYCGIFGLFFYANILMF